MIYFTVHGWFFWKDNKGELQLLVKGDEVNTMSCMFPAEEVAQIHTTRNSVDKVLPELREKLPDLLFRAATERKMWMTELDRTRLIELYGPKKDV